MSNKQDRLFQIIHSLSSAEKGYFKKFCNTWSQNNNSRYLVLFDAIDKAKSYNEKELLKRLPSSITKNQFAVMKHYLNGTLLKSLRAYHSAQSIRIQINEYLINTELFFKKRLFDLSLKEIKKAKRLLEDAEMPHYYYEVAHWERLINNQKGYSPDVDAEMKHIHEKEMQLSEVLLNNSKYSWLSFQVFSRAARSGSARQKKDLIPFHELMKSPLLADRQMALSGIAKCHFWNIKAKYFEIIGDFFESCQELLFS